MKRLIVFAVMLLMSSGSAFSVVYCSDPAGTWGNYPSTPPAGNGNYDCTGDSSPGTFSCDVYLYDGTNICRLTYTGNGYDVSTGHNNWNASYVSGTCGHWHSGTSWSGYFTLDESCTRLQDSVVNNVNGGGTYVTRTKGMDGTTNTWCEVPGNITTNKGGEKTSQFDGWDTGVLYGPAVATWHAVLTDAADTTFNFGGRDTVEAISTNTGWNGCILSFPGGPPTGSDSWSVTSSHNYSVGDPADDGTGLTTTGNYYIDEVQNNFGITIPCTVTIQQIMKIDCPTTFGTWGGEVQYENHNIIYVIGDGTWAVDRNTSLPNKQTETWGQKRTVWKWWAWWFYHMIP